MTINRKAPDSLRLPPEWEDLVKEAHTAMNMNRHAWLRWAVGVGLNDYLRKKKRGVL